MPHTICWITSCFLQQKRSNKCNRLPSLSTPVFYHNPCVRACVRTLKTNSKVSRTQFSVLPRPAKILKIRNPLLYMSYYSTSVTHTSEQLKVVTQKLPSGLFCRATHYDSSTKLTILMKLLNIPSRNDHNNSK